jgi:hypothetical protein
MQARGVAMGHIRNHLALARKVNDYLQAGKPEADPFKAHVREMETWLSKMEAQLTASMPRVYKMEAPDINNTWNWVEDMCEETLDQIDWDIQKHGCMLHGTAVRTQQALVAALVTGCYCPPPRLYVIKTMLHPDFQGGCQDPDCNVTRMGGECKGNRLELGTLPPPPEGEEPSSWLHHGYLTTDISNIVVHHKTDR